MYGFESFSVTPTKVEQTPEFLIFAINSGLIYNKTYFHKKKETRLNISKETVLTLHFSSCLYWTSNDLILMNKWCLNHLESAVQKLGCSKYFCDVTVDYQKLPVQ